MTRRAKVGYRPCRARPTHILIPLRYVVGDFSDKKPGESRCGWSTAHGRLAFLLPPFTQSGLTFPPLGIGRLNPSVCVPLRCLMAHLGPCAAPTSAVSPRSTQEAAELIPNLKCA